MSTSSMLLDHSFNSQESGSARPESERESERLKLLLDMTTTLVSTLECRDLLRTVSASIRQVMHCDIVGVWLPDAERVHLRQLAMDFPESKGFVKEDALQPIEGSVIGAVFKAGKPVVLDLSRERFASPVSAEVRAEGIESGCALPLISRGRTLGVLTLGSRIENSMRPEDVDFLLRAAGQLAIAIENRLAYREVAELKDKLAQEKLYLEDEIRGEIDFEGIIGQSSVLRHVLKLVETVAPSDSTVLLLGETGTGKERIARALHDRSRRRDQTFVRLNCAAIPTGLLESELFGHEKGAFTGAITQKIGRLELADQGTLFLDEVGDIPIEIQPKLLRALQEREFERLGSTHTRKVNVRLVAATNRDLEKMIAAREFRSDLYYRLNVFPIRIPPLRERKEDISLLVSYFVQKFAKQMQKNIVNIPAAVMKALIAWEWPGNVREVENFIERAVILTRGRSLMAPLAELRKVTTEEPRAAATNTVANHDDIARIVKETISALHGNSSSAGDHAKKQRDQIVQALTEAKGRVGGADGAAARLRVNRTTLLARMKKLGIDPRDYS